MKNYLCSRKSKSEDSTKPISRNVKQDIIFSRSGVTSCCKRRNNNVITGTFGFCHRPEVISDEV